MSGLVQVAPASSQMLTTALMAGLAGASVPLVMLIAMAGVAATGNALAQFSRSATARADRDGPDDR
jgi:amino acid transporter